MPDQPVPQFNRFNRLDELSQRISDQMRELLLSTHAEGVKDGLELAAQLCDAAAKTTRELPIVTDFHCAQIATAEFLRDQARLMAHQIPNPEVTP